MKILVTGSEGFIGSCLVPMLAEAGHDAARLDINWFADCAIAPPPAVPPLIRRDFRSLGASDLAGFDAVVHLAALSNDALGDLEPALTHDINHRAAVDLARRARDSGAERFVFSSTCSVYGMQSDALVTETCPPNPLTPYAASKAAAEREIMALATPAFCPVILRHGTAYGWSNMVRFDLVVNNLVASACLNREIRLLSDGSAWRPLVHVRDISQSFLAALEAGADAVRAQVFNIGRTADNWRIIDLAHRIAAEIPGCPVVIGAGAQADKRSYRVDCTRAQTRLPGFAPRVSVADGIAELVARVSQVPPARLQSLFSGRLSHLKMLRGSGALDHDLCWAA